MRYESEGRRKMYTRTHTRVTFTRASQLPATQCVSIGIARIAILTPSLHQSSIVPAEKLIELWFLPVTRISGRTPFGDWFTLVFITTRTRRRDFFTISAIAPCSGSTRTIVQRMIKISRTKSFSNKKWFFSFYSKKSDRNAIQYRKSVACEIVAKEIDNEWIRIPTIKPLTGTDKLA